MRFKDFAQSAYVFGENETVCDIAHDADDIAAGVAKADARRIITLIDNYVSAIWWLHDRVPEDVQRQFARMLLNQPHPSQAKMVFDDTASE